MPTLILSITVGVNTSPLAGTEGGKFSSAMIRERLLREEAASEGTIKVNETDSSEVFDVYGSSEERLVGFVEAMRGEGFELTVSDLQCLFRRGAHDPNTLEEPWEEFVVHAPLDFLGEVIEAIARRCGSLVDTSEVDGEVRAVFHVPTRSLRGFGEELVNVTRGFGVFTRDFLMYREKVDASCKVDGPKGCLISSETGEVVGYALSKLQGRGIFYIKPHDKVYAGMIVGEQALQGDLEINVLKGKALSTMRASGSDEAYQLSPPKSMSLEGMLGCLGRDACVEVTPVSLRMRKKILDTAARQKVAMNQGSSSSFKIL